jgi:hypothetical protein
VVAVEFAALIIAIVVDIRTYDRLSFTLKAAP